MQRLRTFTLALFVAALAMTGLAGTAGAATHHASPVLGHKNLYGKYGKGWGAHRPRHIYNGGDPNGDVTGIHWYSWSRPTANGHGSGNQFKPGGGYYSTPVTVQFHATNLGHCTTHGPMAYRRLYVRFETRPGSKRYDAWQLWGGNKSLCHLS